MLNWLILLLMCVAFVLSLCLTRLSRGLGHRWALLDAPGERKIHELPIPATGGIGITWTVVVMIGVCLLGAWVVPQSLLEGWASGVLIHLPGVREQSVFGGCFLLGVLVLHGLGLIDDRVALGPFVKLGVQLLVAGWMVVVFNVRLLELVGVWGSVTITVFYFIVIINAFNFLDNMDGLSGGVGVVCATMLLITAVYSGQWFVAGVLAVLIGALLGFLVFNFPPASLFMGDGGSLVVGFVIAFCSVRITYIDPVYADMQGFSKAWWGVLSPVMILAIPLYDFTSVTVIRMLQGKSPFVGDTQHFSHRLVRKGISKRAAVGIIWACTLATGLGGVILPFLQDFRYALLVFIQTLAILLVLALLEYKTPGGEYDL